MSDLTQGDLLVTQDHGLLPVVGLVAEARVALWSVLFPAGALCNDAAVLLPPGQPVLVQSPHAVPFCGAAQVLVPASALEGWRGIAPHVPDTAEPILQIRLSRPGLVQTGPGLVVGIEGAETPERDLIRLLLTAHGLPVLPLAAARHLVATLIAEETGQGLRRAEQAAGHAARVTPPNRA